jgi:ACR3 family arsenite transporter
MRLLRTKSPSFVFDGRFCCITQSARQRRVLHPKTESRFKRLFERYLTLWVALCNVAVLPLGSFSPGACAMLVRLEHASVHLVVAVPIWAVVYPLMVAVGFGSLKSVGQQPKRSVINWPIKPFTMEALGVLFFSICLPG